MSGIDNHTPITKDEYSSLLSACLPNACDSPEASQIALAVSGGADSTALALATADWAGTSKNKLIAFIVDHKLRATSTNEAKSVSEQLLRLGIQTEILTWEHSEITNDLHATARKARYTLLESACNRHNRKYLLLGHHSDDQAETILMRIAKGTGIDGLAGIRPYNKQNGIIRLRPFLNQPKARLIATCHQAGIPFVDDQSNASPNYARGRLRAVMPHLEAEGFTSDRLTDLGRRAAQARDALDHYAERLTEQSVETELCGSLKIQLGLWREHPQEIQYRALARCLKYIHQTEYPPSFDAVNTLIHGLSSEDNNWGKTINGVVVKNTGNLLQLYREYSAIPQNQPITDRIQTWDQRWQVHCSNLEYYAGCVLNPLGNPPHGLLDKLSPDIRKLIPQGQKRATIPSLWRNGVLFAIPTINKLAAPLMANLARTLESSGDHKN